MGIAGERMIMRNETALITGASRGLGLKIAEAMWQQGANLILLARSAEALEAIKQQLLSTKVHSAQQIEIIAADMAQLDFSVSSIDKVTILINNAAVQGPIGTVWENDWKAWQTALQVNLVAPIGLCRAVIPHMISRGRGKIINLSGGGATGPRPNFSAYAVAKVGLVRFSETLAQEVRDYHIDVNCIAPGVMNSPLLQTVLAAGIESAGETEYAVAIKQAEANSDATVRRAAELCVYLASEKSNGITGRLISAVWDPWETLHEREFKESDIYTLRRIVPRDRGQDWGEK